jgi:hypothetical protein
MSDAGTTTPTGLEGLTPEQLAGLQQFQTQLTWIASQERAQGKQAGAKDLAEKLGMTVEEAVAKLKTLEGKPPEPPKPTGEQTQQQAQAAADLERRLTALEQRSAELDQRETTLTEREVAVNQAAQTTIKVEALTSLNMTPAQAQAASAMLQLPPGVTEFTPELAAASAQNLKTAFPALFPAADASTDQNGGGQTTSTGQGGAPGDTHTRGTQATGGGSSTQSADERANARLKSRGHVKTPTS